jgi:Zn-dependent protease with chaperone function
MESGPAMPEVLCPDCGVGLLLLGDATNDACRLYCPDCGARFRARRRGPAKEKERAGGRLADPGRAGPLALAWRGAALWGMERAYRLGVLAGTIAMLAMGGFAPVIRGWLLDEIDGWAGIVEALGGVRVVTKTNDPDGDLGPVLARADAPRLFDAVSEVSRRLGVRPPGQIRLTYLPCCGVVAWGRSQALVLGLPLLRVLNLAELRAVLAHELAHLARGDANRAAQSARFVEGLGHALERSAADGRSRGPLRAWAQFCWRGTSLLIGPIAHGQEVRADRSAATIAGGRAASSALVKVAMVQPLFREVLGHYDPERPDAPNLYAFFRAFWYRLPAEVHSAMRLQILANGHASDDRTHPPLPDRLALLQSYPDPCPNQADAAASTTLLSDLETLEQMLHNRLFGIPPVEPTVYHRCGT